MSELLNSGFVGTGTGNFFKKWEQLGFLDGIENHNSKVELSYLFEVMANYLLTGNKFDSFGERILLLEVIKKTERQAHPDVDRFEILAFPIIRRVFVGNDFEIFNIFEAADLFIKMSKEIDYIEYEKELLKTAYNNIDVEAEITASFCDDYISIINNKSKKRFLLLEKQEFFVTRPKRRRLNFNYKRR